MIWLAVFPTMTVINLVFGEQLATLHPVLRTFVLATVAVPIVIYGIMPHLHRLRARLVNRATSGPAVDVADVSRQQLLVQEFLG
jgi:antibiotic biosynthesis monooxygenase (ABM) superfamily enzyme